MIVKVMQSFIYERYLDLKVLFICKVKDWVNEKIFNMQI